MLSKKEKKRFIEMIRRYLDGKASPQETAFVESYYRHFDQDAHGSAAGTEWQAIEDRIFRRLMGLVDIGEVRGKAGPLRALVYRGSFLRAAAAAVILGIGCTWWLGRGNVGRKPVVAAAMSKRDVLPGGNKATLTLANGRTIILDSAADGNLAMQGRSSVVKLANGQLAYEPHGANGNTTTNGGDVGGSGNGGRAAETMNGGAGAAAGSMYNRLATPVGGQYQLVLPDGTRVWLNSASSIRYPTAFTGRDRGVEVTGQAYFEVKDDPRKPFVVHARGTIVQVLGTHFDVMAYEDEASVNTTLVEGKVKVRAGGEAAVLKPGEQARVQNGSAAVAVRTVDTDKETAWTTGFFEFDQTDLPTLMRQLRRWYGIEPVYRGDGGGRLFGGRISRNLKLSELLDLLQGNGIHFSIEGKKLIVLP